MAANVTEYGTGSLNIDGCRIDASGSRPKIASDRRNGNGVYQDGQQGSKAVGTTTLGRWPANVCLDGDAAAMLDAQSGNRPAGHRVNPSTASSSSRKVYGGFSPEYVHGERGYPDSGGASRFFYVAKASRSERNAGLDGMPDRTKQGVRPNSADMSGKFPDHDHRPAGGNHHPTVKPIALMRWLVRLVTPPDGIVCDPFLGSGTTGCAAVLEGFDFIGIEQDAEYLEIARRRIAHARGPLFAEGAT